MPGYANGRFLLTAVNAQTDYPKDQQITFNLTVEGE